MATISANSGLFKGLLLDYYYERRALSECGLIGQFILKKARFGMSNLVQPGSVSGGGFNISNIPPDFSNSDLRNQFAEVDLVLSVTGSTINITAEVKEKDFPDANTHQFNTLVIVDDQGEACAVLCCQQDSLYKGKSFKALLTIEQKVVI